MQAQSSPLERLGPIAVRLSALWVLAVSTIKLLQGSPNDIPLIVRENFPGGAEVCFFATISIELSFALVTLLYPRWGWILMSALSAVFIAVLIHLISIGATSCGCFGGAIKLPPWAMLAIDGSLLAFMLATRPWRSLSPKPPPGMLLAGAAALGVAAPWVLIHNEPVQLPPAEAIVHVEPLPGGAPATALAPSAVEPDLAADEGGGAVEGHPGGAAAPQAPARAAWQLPAPLPKWARLRPPDWVGKSIHATDLAIWMDTRAYLEDATWILYLDTCTHCRDFLRELAANFAQDPKLYVFVKLATADDETYKQVDEMPPGDTATLPAAVSWVVGPELPPWELVLEGGVVVSATHRGE